MASNPCKVGSHEPSDIAFRHRRDFCVYSLYSPIRDTCRLVWPAAYGWPLRHDLRLCTVRCTLVSACSLCFMSHCIFCLLMGVWALLTGVWAIDDDSFRHAFLYVVCMIPKSLNIVRFILLCSSSLCLTGLWAIVFLVAYRDTSAYGVWAFDDDSFCVPTWKFYGTLAIYSSAVKANCRLCHFFRKGQ